ncbi:hypothetical protein [Micromonospora sp. GCM10011541]|uniref:hypothetical protein n=1 Tax=Micromonospora sp. GCM10011541 TaxID=3317336 RepID=UPI00361643B8
MTEINNERVFELNDQDPELVARAFVEAMEKIAKHFKKIGVSAEVVNEVNRQEEEWGEQDHPFTPEGVIGNGYHAEYQWRADRWKRENDYRAGVGHPAWDGILLEEVYEALAEEDPEKREVELVQVAAVAVSAILASRRARSVNL